MATIQQFANNNIVINEDSGKIVLLPPGITPAKQGNDILWLNEDLKVVKGTPASSITTVTDRAGTITTIDNIDTLFNTLRDSFFFSIGTGSGLGAIPFATRSTDGLTAVFTSIALRDTYYTTTAPGDIASNTDLGQGREAVGIGPTDGSPVGVTAAFIRNAANDDWIPIATNFVGPQGPTGADSTVPGPAGPPGALFDEVEITADITINVANLATYENRDVINTRTTLGQVTVTLDTIANFLTADPTDEFILRFINESAPSTMVITPGANNFFAQTSGSITLNQGQVFAIKLPSSGTRWNVLNESASAIGGIVPPVTPTPLPAGIVVVTGNWDPTTGSFPSGVSQGAIYLITANGTVDSIAFFSGDYLFAEVDNPSTTTFAGNWGVIPGKGAVHSLFGRQGILDDAFMIANLDRLGYQRNTGVVDPSFHEFLITTIPNRVDLNTDLNGAQTVAFSVTNHGDIASATIQADPVTIDTFIDVATLTVPTIDGVQQQTVLFAGLTSDTEKTISFRVRTVDSQGSVHLSNEYDVAVRTLTTQEQVHFGFILSTETANDIVFATDDIEARDTLPGSWTVSGIPDDGNLYRVYFAVPVNQGSVSQVTQNGVPITGQFANNLNVPIEGNNYNVLLLNVASAVNNNYNTTVLQAA